MKDIKKKRKKLENVKKQEKAEKYKRTASRKYIKKMEQQNQKYKNIGTK